MAFKQPKKQNLEKQHAKITEGKKKDAVTPSYQWSVQGDFFSKFSLFKETSSGFTSANTTYRP